MRRFSVLTVVLLLVLAAAPPASAGQPLFLWTVEGPHATIAMTGSIHVGKPDFFPLAAPLEQAFRDADALAVEVDVEDPANQQAAAAIIFQKGMLPGDETLESRLGGKSGRGCRRTPIPPASRWPCTTRSSRGSWP